MGRAGCQGSRAEAKASQVSRRPKEVAHAQSLQGNSQRPCVENRSPRKSGIEKKRCVKDRAQSMHEASHPESVQKIKRPHRLGTWQASPGKVYRGGPECFLTSVHHICGGMGQRKKLFTLLDLCVSSLRRGHANLLCIVPILTDDPRRESENIQSWLAGDSCAFEMRDESDGF